MTSDSERKAAEEWIVGLREKNKAEAARYSSTTKWSGLYDGQEIRESFLAGRSSALKELEQIAREAFEAGKRRGQYEMVELRLLCTYSHEDSLLGLPNFTDYWQKKTESKEIEPQWKRVKEVMDSLTDGERELIIKEYCECGSKNTGCQCWNDE
jgi:hypothetical protein